MHDNHKKMQLQDLSFLTFQRVVTQATLAKFNFRRDPPVIHPTHVS
jgi:hypothetical protein